MESSLPVGVIEGFYGKPWSCEERLACIQQMAGWGWNTYVWAAKSEPRHRDEWDKPFTQEELSDFSRLASHDERVKLLVGVTPGSGASAKTVIEKMTPSVKAGALGVVLCFDDLPVLDAARQHKELAHAVADVLGVMTWIVPTHYAGMTSSPYLDALCDGLQPEIEIMWTGNLVVNDSIHLHEAHARTLATGGRRPLVWDNVPVNDALMSSHLHLGPYVGRESNLRDACSGWMWNPMISHKASMVMLESAAAWWRGDDPILAWETIVDRDGWRTLAEATAYRGEHHWPGDFPDRTWWESVRDMSDDEPTVSTWVGSARLGATVALAALDLLEASDADLTTEFVSRGLGALMMWSGYRTQSALTLGAGPRRRPMATQDDRGRFQLLPGSVIQSESLVDALVSRALTKLAR